MLRRRLKKWPLVRRDTLDETTEPKSPVSSSSSRIDGSAAQRSSDIGDRGGENTSGQDRTIRDKQSRSPAASPSAEPTSPIANSPNPSPTAPQDTPEAQLSPPRPVPQLPKDEAVEVLPEFPSVQEHLKLGLWEQAYDAFRDSEPMLASQYEQIIAAYRPLTPATTKQNEDMDSLTDHVGANEFTPLASVARRARMRLILDDWLQGGGGPEVDKFQGGAPNMSGIIHSFREIIRPMVMETMQTSATAWVAAYFAARALFNSHASALSDAAGSNFVSVLPRMGWYCRLQKLLPSELLRCEKLEEQTSAAIEGKREDPQDALADIYKAVLSYLIRLSCNNGNNLIEFHVHDKLYEEIGRKEQAFSIKLDFWGPAVEKQLRQLVASVARGQPTYIKVDATAGDKHEAGDDADSTSSKLLDGLFAQPCDSADFDLTPDRSKPGLETAYMWLVSTPQYLAFRDRSGTQGDFSQCLWITGPYGTGKSMLLKAAAWHMKRSADHPQENSDRVHKVASFFCNGGKARTENAALVVQSLLAQVLKEQPALVNHQTKRWLEAGSDGELTRLTNFYDVSAAFCAMLKEGQFLATCFVVDAIDECSVNGDQYEAERGLNDLLNLVSTTIGLSDKVRWLLSLDSTITNERLVSMANAVQLHLGSYPGALHPAVLNHVDSKVEELLRNTSRAQGNRYDHEFHESIHKFLVERSRDNFLWIDLACEIIRSHGSPWNALHILHELPLRLKALYFYAKKAIMNLPMDDPIYCNKVMDAMALAYRPLRISELIDLADLPPIVDPSIVIAKCSVFLQVHEDTVSVVHRSAKIFLTDEIEAQLEAHANITRLCLAHLSKALCAADSKKRTSPEKPAHYASFYWLQHLSAMLDFVADSKTIDVVTQFLDGYFLQWVETLALYPGFSQVLIQMSVVEDKLRGHSSGGAPQDKPVRVQMPASDSNNFANCLRLIQDACRLLRFHLTTKNPSQVKLNNSVLFCPQLGATREKMLKSGYPWLVSAPALQAGSDFITLEGHTDWVRSCAYSDNGRFLASSSDDATVRIWHPDTGELHRELTGFGGWVYRVVFSRRGLLATMEDTTIKIWDSATYVLRRSFCLADLDREVTVRHARFGDIEFSADGNKLGAVAGSCIVIWDINSYNVIKTLTYSSDSSRLRFSRNDQLATTVGHKVVVWSLKNGSVLWESESVHRECIGLCYSQDSRWLAAGSINGEIWIWDVTSDSGEPPSIKKPCKTFAGHEQIVVSLAFSPGGARLASGSYDGTIRLWDVEGGDNQVGKVLLGHTQDISAVCFSPDGRHLASSSDDATVRIWDMDAELDNPADERNVTDSESKRRHTHEISFVTISTGGRLMASGSSDGLICLWDAYTGEYRASLREHAGEILWLALSANGRRLTSTSRAGNEVMIWDTENAKLLYSFPDHYDWVRCAVFSPDPGGRLLASASDDSFVRVWDLELEASNLGEQRDPRLKMRLSGHTDYVCCVSFSADGRYLASGGDDLTVRVWDLTRQKPEPEKKTSNDDDNQSTSTISESDSPHNILRGLPPGRVTGVAFSLDGQRVVSSSQDGAITIWDHPLDNKGQQQMKQQFTLAESFTSLHYSPSHPDWILTETGAHLLVEGTYSPPPLEWTRWGLSKKRDWILCGGREKIFLPQRYRPNVKTARVHSGRVVIGCRSGHVMVFRFREDVEEDD